ncbi:sensor histidine kinase [Nonomuraea fuscirosea]|uniref:sensor histidine kinase n=1 Tax=Nonomuraea fuscirosea TaxID=1291556 RepID=UPI0034238031
MLTIGGPILLAATLAAFGLGRRTAGWVLRPVSSATETARRVAQSHDLNERIGYTGPADEVGELSAIFDTMLARLARSFDGQRRFVANTSHELRTPLAINRTLVDVAVRRPDATDDVKRLGESLLMVNSRHERLIDGLLALAEGEQALLDRRPFDLTDVAEHVLDQLAGAAADRRVTIHRLLDASPTAGEAVLMERLVQNLVEYAIKHDQPGRRGLGHHTAAGRAGGAGRREHRAAGAAVRDREHLRAVPAAAQRPAALGPGSGLGLSIVRVIAEAHGGTVVARPRDKGGPTITVELPADRR